MSTLKKIWWSIGPGFITGAADDDPSAYGHMPINFAILFI